MKRDTFIIFNPYDSDAICFINAMTLTFGMRPICIYTDPKERFYVERARPELVPSNPEAVISTTVDELRTVVDRLAETFNIRAVIPFREHYVELCALALEQLDIDWMSGPDLALFRDKHRMKAEITKRDPSIRVPYSRLVNTVDDVFDNDPPDSFVIKPNAGAGSVFIGFFTSDDRERVAAHLAQSPETTWILEERIEGPEYRINGLVRRDGTVQILLMSEYQAIELSNTNVFPYANELQLRSNDERWGPLADYTARILRAGGMWGSPFHLEVKVDDLGPAVVDLAARVGSDGTGHTLSMLHPDRPDLFSVAVRDYVGNNDFAMEPINYDFYDSGACGFLCGILDTPGYLLSIDGIEEVEARPEFVRWDRKPEIGELMERTVDLQTSAYVLTYRLLDEPEASFGFRDWVDETIVLHTDPDAPPWSTGRRRDAVSKVLLRAGWEVRARR